MLHDLKLSNCVPCHYCTTSFNWVHSGVYDFNQACPGMGLLLKCLPTWICISLNKIPTLPFCEALSRKGPPPILSSPAWVMLSSALWSCLLWALHSVTLKPITFGFSSTLLALLLIRFFCLRNLQHFLSFFSLQTPRILSVWLGLVMCKSKIHSVCNLRSFCRSGELFSMVFFSSIITTPPCPILGFLLHVGFADLIQEGSICSDSLVLSSQSISKILFTVEMSQTLHNVIFHYIKWWRLLICSTYHGIKNTKPKPTTSKHGSSLRVVQNIISTKFNINRMNYTIWRNFLWKKKHHASIWNHTQQTAVVLHEY